MILVILLFFINSEGLAQNQNIKSPKKAAIMSAIIPGLGQVYNKKYWKIPIIYTGFGTSIYYANKNHSKYELYKQEYLKRINNEIDQNPELINYTSDDLNILKNHYRRNREISYLFLALTYVLNIIDASVDSHLFEYDISKELSLNITPIIYNQVQGVHLSIKL